MFVAIIVAIAVAYIVYAVPATICEIREEEAEAEEFERRRAERRMRVVQKDKETARMELIDAWAKVGRLGYYNNEE